MLCSAVTVDRGVVSHCVIGVECVMFCDMCKVLSKIKIWLSLNQTPSLGVFTFSLSYSQEIDVTRCQ